MFGGAGFKFPKFAAQPGGLFDNFFCLTMKVATWWRRFDLHKGDGLIVGLHDFFYNIVSHCVRRVFGGKFQKPIINEELPESVPVLLIFDSPQPGGLICGIFSFKGENQGKMVIVSLE
jgi:hypothetical protein